MKRYVKTTARSFPSVEDCNNRAGEKSQRGDYPAALDLYNQALRIMDNVDSWIGKGYMLTAMRRYEEAESCFNCALRGGANNKTVLTGKAFALKFQRKYAEALECFDASLALGRNDQYTLIGRGEVLIELGRNDEALADFEETARFAPQLEVAWRHIGFLWLMSKNYEAALQSFNRVIEINPQFRLGQLLRISLLIMLGHTDEIEPQDVADLNSLRNVLETEGVVNTAHRVAPERGIGVNLSPDGNDLRLTQEQKKVLLEALQGVCHCLGAHGQDSLDTESSGESYSRSNI